VQVALYTHCVASSECRWRYTHTVWPVQSAGGAIHTLCGQFSVQVALYARCVASSECRNIQTGGAIHTFAVLRSNQILHIHLTA